MKSNEKSPFFVFLAAGVLLITLTSWLAIRGHRAAENPEAESATGKARRISTFSSPASILPELIPLPLGLVSVTAENSYFLTNLDFQPVPRGTNIWNGIEFHVDAMFQLASTGAEKKQQFHRQKVRLPLSEAGISDARLSGVHVIAATRFDGKPEPIAEVVWHYSAGGTRRTQILQGFHVRSFIRPPFEQPAHLPYNLSKVIWRSTEATLAGKWSRLYRMTFVNPERNRPIKAIELISTRGETALCVLAATVDTGDIEARVINAEDLEPEDALIPRSLDLVVQDDGGQPISDAELKVTSSFGVSGLSPTVNYLKTDGQGRAQIGYPPQNLDLLEIDCRASGYGERRLTWDVQHGYAIPETYILTLSKGATIGGIVVNEKEEPISGAVLDIFRFYTGTIKKYEMGDTPQFSERTTTTDPGGLWELRDVGREFVESVGVNVHHPDYTPRTVLTLADPGLDAALITHSSRIVLQSGLKLSGEVRDETETPIPRAKVARESFQNPQNRIQIECDEAGRFIIPHVEPGTGVFSAIAEGFAPEKQTLKVDHNSSPLIFHLKPGHTIKGRVVDETGQPLAGVSVILENAYKVDPKFEFSVSTGENGRFAYTSAPEGGNSFSFAKEGYEQLHWQRLNADIDNTVTLRAPRTLEGHVTDAVTGQPISNFSVGLGNIVSGMHEQGGFLGAMVEHRDPAGTFSAKIDQDRWKAVRVTADGYDGVNAYVPTSGMNRNIVMEFPLPPSPTVRAKVVSWDGQPQPGAQVLLTEPGSIWFGTVLKSGRLTGVSDLSAVLTADENGIVQIHSPPLIGGLLVAANPHGFGMSALREGGTDVQIVLEPYGELEGFFHPEGSETADKFRFYFSLLNIGIVTDVEEFTARPDKAGKFFLHNLPPLEGRLVRMKEEGWDNGDGTPIRILPGQTISWP